ncbi:CBS domain-containing protein [Sphaerisporangium fuscum]|uniref:CBS domain-containing protein n=1 Tax=Sphaerisporangium fuscum TaxID=2835868 RepID=UPI001BDD1236|nr:CBS domain-containing protein [Sphaerisporangium fuscum]
MKLESMTAADVMSRMLITVKPDESPLMAWELMRRGGIHHLPVVDSRSRVVGVLKQADIAEHWSGGPAEQSKVGVGRLLARRRCPHVPPDASISEVAAMMIDLDVDVVPVIGDSQRLEGLITATDVLRAVAGRDMPSRPSNVVTGLFHLEPVLPPQPGAPFEEL